MTRGIMFDEWTIRLRSVAIRCDIRTYKKELRKPGSVRGVIGIVIRQDIEQVRRERNGGKP